MCIPRTPLSSGIVLLYVPEACVLVSSVQVSAAQQLALQQYCCLVLDKDSELRERSPVSSATTMYTLAYRQWQQRHLRLCSNRCFFDLLLLHGRVEGMAIRPCIRAQRLSVVACHQKE